MELAHIANDISVFVGTLAKFLAILKMVHIANAVLVFISSLAKFLGILKMVHITNAPCFCMILGPDLMPTSDDMPKFVDVIMVNRSHFA